MTTINRSTAIRAPPGLECFGPKGRTLSEQDNVSCPDTELVDSNGDTEGTRTPQSQEHSLEDFQEWILELAALLLNKAGEHRQDKCLISAPVPDLTSLLQLAATEPEEPEEEDLTFATFVGPLWRKCLPGKGTAKDISAAARRWSRLVGKIDAQNSSAVPLENQVPTSVGSVAHSEGRPCRPCRFHQKGKCFDGVLCGLCHFSCGHTVAPKQPKTPVVEID